MDNHFHLLSLVLFLPLVGALVVLFTNPASAIVHRNIAFTVTIATLVLSLGLAAGYVAPSAGHQFQFVENSTWLPGVGLGGGGVHYHLGIDGIGLLMVLMTTAIFPFVVGVSAPSIQDRTKIFYFLVLFVESAILGTFVSLDLILFYIFYEAMLIPLYFLIGIWGGEKRVYATMKFFLYTMVGSMLMLVSIISMYLMTGTFDLSTLQTSLPVYLATHYGQGGAGRVEMLLFLGFFAAFAVKAPLWPFHTWVPDAYAEAPTGATIILVALKMGLYGFIRFCLPLFPNAVQEAAPVIVTLAVIGVIYAALAAAVQRDLKRLLAYSSVSHIGVIMLAIFSLTSLGLSGAVVQMFSHTFTTGGLFILAYYLYVRRGSYNTDLYGGVWRVMPFFAALFLIVTLSSIALPGTSGFMGEFLCLIGALQTHPWAAGFATTAAIWSAVYMLFMFKNVMQGPVTRPEVEGMRDVGVPERFAMALIVAIIVFVGVYPSPLLRALSAPTQTIIAQVAPTPSPTSPIGTQNAPSVASQPSQLAPERADALVAAVPRAHSR